jgi:hypothetical protein
MGAQLVRDGTLIQRERGSLMSTFNGNLQPLDGVVVMKNSGALNPNDAQTINNFESGLTSGLARSGSVPVVGVETTSTNPSQIGWYKQQNLASVDDIDDLAGRTALIYELGGAKGTYGVKPSAQGLLPNIVGAP